MFTQMFHGILDCHVKAGVYKREIRILVKVNRYLFFVLEGTLKSKSFKGFGHLD